MKRENEKILNYFIGLKSGIPIFLGYISVSFTFGMMAVKNGFSPWMALLISMTNLTSAGQFAGTALIASGAMYVETALTTFIINIRYMLMSLSLSQKVDESMTFAQRAALSMGITDEIFALAMQRRCDVTASYFAGLITLPYVGWVAGTFLGATAAEILPTSVQSALGIAIYAMFIAILIPDTKKSLPAAFTVIFSALLSCAFSLIPFLRCVSSGWRIIICTLVCALTAAFAFPLKEEEVKE